MTGTVAAGHGACLPSLTSAEPLAGECYDRRQLKEEPPQDASVLAACSSAPRPPAGRPRRLKTASGRFFAQDRHKRLQNQSLSCRSRRANASLDYLHARYYSPHLGRFFSVDPQNRYRAQGNPQLWDRYTYTAGNPLKYIDPNGKDLKIVYDFSKSNLTYREQLNLKIAVRRTFVNAGVRNVQSFSAGGAIQPAVRKSTDRIVYVKIKAEPMKSGGFGNTPPLSNKSTVSTARAPAEADKKLTFLTNVTAHEVGHGSRALDQYVFDGAGGPSGDHGTVMQEDEAVESYSSKMLDFSPQDAKALQQTLNDPCDKSSGNCEEPEKK